MKTIKKLIIFGAGIFLFGCEKTENLEKIPEKYEVSWIEFLENYRDPPNRNESTFSLNDYFLRDGNKKIFVEEFPKNYGLIHFGAYDFREFKDFFVFKNKTLISIVEDFDVKILKKLWENENFELLHFNPRTRAHCGIVEKKYSGKNQCQKI